MKIGAHQKKLIRQFIGDSAPTLDGPLSKRANHLEAMGSILNAIGDQARAVTCLKAAEHLRIADSKQMDLFHSLNS